MSKYAKLLIVVVLVVGISLGAIYFLFYLKDNNSTKVTENYVPQSKDFENPQESGDLGYEEPQTKVAIGTEGVSKGVYSKVEGGNIFFDSNGAMTQLPLTVDEVVLACTDQNLDNATELDYNQVTKVNIYTPDTLGVNIPDGQTIVVFASDVEGTLRAHTVALASTSCK